WVSGFQSVRILLNIGSKPCIRSATPQLSDNSSCLLPYYLLPCLCAILYSGELASQRWQPNKNMLNVHRLLLADHSRLPSDVRAYSKQDHPMARLRNSEIFCSDDIV